VTEEHNMVAALLVCGVGQGVFYQW